ncbi:sporulation protein [Streptomyces pactum]|uniref:Sporulation protein n=1 Tax=Streptomyces pactum TaxID=68249 RepID=A0ABS0NH51_9ACTN|nr:sporulation protein [Streptomyces pactum]MBH5334522.1 sporulation protein [Streptomyces pactum]
MAFRKFLSALGVNAPSVETVLDNTTVRPGDQLGCEVTMRGGGADVTIERLTLQVVTRFEDMETTEDRWENPGVLVSGELPGPFTLAAGAEVTERVVLDLPWEMPLTHILGGRRLRGARVAVRTELAIDNAVDRGDFDEFAVHALPQQDMVLQAYSDLGFRFDEAECKKGTPSSAVRSQVDWWQEIEMWFPADYRNPGQNEIAFNARHDSLDLLTGGTGRLEFRYADMDLARVTEVIDEHARSRFAR